MKQTTSIDDILSIRDTCECLQARSRAHLLTQAYDEIMAPSGLRITQFNVVSVLMAGGLTMKELSIATEIDRTTLTRNLLPLEREGLVAITGGDDARKRIVSLTDAGRRATEKAYVLWRQAQAIYSDPNKNGGHHRN